ncbi:MAG: hypothetical protein JEZ07_17730 [Phycisphaerae bacterium]|nr:hypothetical protein [Phycisphaerae bacterium]
MGRRVQVDLYTNESLDSSTLYYYDGWKVLAEKEGSAVREFVYGNYLDEVLLMNDGTDDYYFEHDHRYSPTAILDASGNVQRRYEYDAFGKRSEYAADFTNPTSSFYNPIAYTGQRLDGLDNNTLPLMYFKNRYYDTETGRFITHDPLSYPDGMNLYGGYFATGGGVDPLGLTTWPRGGANPSRPDGHTYPCPNCGAAISPTMMHSCIDSTLPDKNEHIVNSTKKAVEDLDRNRKKNGKKGGDHVIKLSDGSEIICPKDKWEELLEYQRTQQALREAEKAHKEAQKKLAESQAKTEKTYAEIDKWLENMTYENFLKDFEKCQELEKKRKRTQEEIIKSYLDDGIAYITTAQWNRYLEDVYKQAKCCPQIYFWQPGGFDCKRRRKSAAHVGSV